MTSRVRLGIAAVASPLEVGAGEAPALQERLRAAFASLAPQQLEAVPAPRAAVDPDSAAAAGRFFYEQRVDAICLVAASWFEDYLVLDLLEECNTPLVLWARPGMETGSLCGMQQLGYMLKALGQPYILLFAEPGAPVALQRTWDYAQAAALKRLLRRARLGMLGHRVEGMTETTGHELALKKVFGPRIVGIDAPLFLERARGVAPKAVQGRWEELEGQVGQVKVPAEVGIESLQVYTALRQVVEEGGLSAVAVGCYPHLMGKVCLAASLLGEAGTPVACEGDINGALGMLMLTRLTGQPVHNTDLLDPIPEHNSIVLSHCGSGAFSLACSPQEITLGPVRLMDRGLCCLFTAKPGPCTLVNLVPTLAGYRLGVLYGQAIPTTMIFPGNPLEVRFEADHHEILEWIVANGLGHHWMAAYGDLRAPLAHLADMVGCEIVSR